MFTLFYHFRNIRFKLLDRFVPCNLELLYHHIRRYIPFVYDRYSLRNIRIFSHQA